MLDIDRRFSGLERLYGRSRSQGIRQAHVVVVGIGGVGSWAVEALARSGVGRLTLMDMDHVSESNINRQIQALSSTLGMAKIIAMQARISEINPVCVVTPIDDFVTPENWSRLLPPGVDAVIDCCDQLKAKVVMADWARQCKSIFACVGAAGGKRQAFRVDVADLSETTNDPLLAKMRYDLRRFHGAPKAGKKMGVSCIFSSEPVQVSLESCATQQDNTLNCHGYGSLVSVTATFGMCAAGWVMDKISEIKAGGE